MAIRAAAKNTSWLAPENLYTLSGFHRAAGISPSRLNIARRSGIQLETLNVGRRVFVTGEAAIRFIRQLAEFSAAEDQVNQEGDQLTA